MIRGGVNPLISHSPCTSANLASGFDVLAVSLDAFADTVEISGRAGSGRIFIGSDSNIPLDPASNSASITAGAIMRDFEIRDDLTITVKKGIPLSSGLGGSGACAAAAAVSVNEMYSLDIDANSLIEYSGRGEIASGEVHYDNVSAAVLGNLAAVTGVDPLKASKFDLPDGMTFMLVVPETPLKRNTSEMRRIIPDQISFSSHLSNSRYLTSFLAGILTNDRDLIIEGLNDDIVEPVRSKKYSYLERLKKVAADNRALGACLSGSGPSALIICDERTEKGNMKRNAASLMSSSGFPSNIVEARPSGGVWIEN